VSGIAATSMSDRFARCESRLDRLNEAVHRICLHLGIPESSAAAGSQTMSDENGTSRPTRAGSASTLSSISPSPPPSHRPLDEEMADGTRPHVQLVEHVSLNAGVPVTDPVSATCEAGPVLAEPASATTAAAASCFPAPGPALTSLATSANLPLVDPMSAEIGDVQMGPSGPVPPLNRIPATPLNSQDSVVGGPVSVPTSPPAEPIPVPSMAQISNPSQGDSLAVAELVLGPSIPQGVPSIPVDTVAEADVMPGPSVPDGLAPIQAITLAPRSRSRTPMARTPGAASSGLGPITRSRSRSRSPNPVAGEKRRAEDEELQANKKSRVYVEIPPRT